MERPISAHAHTQQCWKEGGGGAATALTSFNIHENKDVLDAWMFWKQSLKVQHLFNRLS